MFYLYGLILILNFVWGLTRNRSKILYRCTLLFIWILLWGRTRGADYGTYLTEYRMGGFIDSGQYLYNLLIVIGKNLNMSYHLFLAIIMGILMCILIYCLRDITGNYHLALGFYLLYAVILDMIQIGNFMALVFIIASLYAILQQKKRSALITMVIAVLLHSIAIFYMPLIFILDNNCNIKPNIKKVIFILTVLMCAVTFLYGNQITWIFSWISTMIKDQRIELYTSTSTRWGFILYFGLYFLSLITVYYAKVIVLNTSKCYRVDEKIIKIQNLTYALNLYCMLGLVFCMGNSNFYRIIRNCSILNFVSFSNAYRYAGEQKYSSIIIPIMFTVSITFYFLRQDYISFYQDMINSITLNLF